jgi:hypothetical protein
MTAIQQTLFGEDEIRPEVKRTGSASQSVVFHDYESFLAKFADNPKTTDDCFTPQDVWEAVVQYVGTVVDLSDKQILRPFFPGGDYEEAIYPENGIVIDNPPFSIFTNIVRFYTARNIPFFLFGNGMTITRCLKYCTAIIINGSITFENGASLPCNFASNLFGDTLIMTAPKLHRAILSCPSQQKNSGKNVNTYNWPKELLTVSDMSSFARAGIEFSVSRNEGYIVNDLDNMPTTSGLFGAQVLISESKTAEKIALENKVHRNIPIELSPRERRIVEQLNK